MLNNIKCYLMKKEDLDYFKNHLSEFDEFWKFDLLKSEFENELTTCIIAKNEEDIVGFASLWEPPYEIHINNIFVKKDLRKNKIGSILLEKLIEIFCLLIQTDQNQCQKLRLCIFLYRTHHLH